MKTLFCRFCGAVFCGKCTEGRQPVPWEENRKARVCRACLQVNLYLKQDTTWNRYLGLKVCSRIVIQQDNIDVVLGADKFRSDGSCARATCQTKRPSRGETFYFFAFYLPLLKILLDLH